jgi:hypothetical protein
MGNISVKINLRRLQSGQMKIKGRSGELVECVVIPIDANNLVRGEKGIYLDLMGFELKERKPERKDTHLVKQSLPKELFEKLTEEHRWYRTWVVEIDRAIDPVIDKEHQKYRAI